MSDCIQVVKFVSQSFDLIQEVCKSYQLTVQMLSQRGEFAMMSSTHCIDNLEQAFGVAVFQLAPMTVRFCSRYQLVVGTTLPMNLQLRRFPASLMTTQVMLGRMDVIAKPGHMRTGSNVTFL